MLHSFFLLQPLFGLLKAKLELITHAYFDERDFSKVELLEQTYNNMNASLKESLLIGTQIFLGLYCKENPFVVYLYLGFRALGGRDGL